MSLSEKLEIMVSEGKFTSKDTKRAGVLAKAEKLLRNVLLSENDLLELGYAGRKSLRSMIYFIGTTFKPAANAVSELLTEKSRSAAKPAKPMKRVDVSPKGEIPQDEGCEDCGTPKTTPTKVKATEEATTEPVTPQLSDAKGTSDVMRFFDSDIEKMKAFAATNEIDLGKASAAEGIAKKIFDWVQA